MYGGKLSLAPSATGRPKVYTVSRIVEHFSLPSLTLFVVFSATPLPASGAGDPPAPTLEAGASPLAEARYQVGRTLYARGDYAGAAREFEIALEIFPQSPKLAFNLARTFERLQDDERALAAYRRYLTIDKAAPDREEIERIIGGLERRVEAARPRLVVTSEPAGAEVRVDGLADRFTTPATITATPGTLVVRLRLPNQPEVTRSVTVARGQSTPLHVTLASPPPPAAASVASSASAPPTSVPPSPEMNPVGFIAAGVGLAALGVGTYFFVRADGLADDAEGLGRNPDELRRHARLEEDHAEALTIGAVSAAVGGGLVVGGLLYAFLATPTDTIALTFGPSGPVAWGRF